MLKFEDLSDEELVEEYGDLALIVAEFEHELGTELTLEEAGILIIYTAWVKEKSSTDGIQ